MAPMQQDSDPGLAASLQQLRIIVAALLFGVVSFAAVAMFLVQSGSFPTSPDLARVLMATLAALAVGATVAYRLVRQSFLGKLRARGGTGERPLAELLQPFQTLTLVGAALAEGCCLFALVIYLLTGLPVALVAAAVGVFALALFFPRRQRFQAFRAAAGGSPAPV